MVPGMHHCQGTGPGPNTFDMLTALDVGRPGTAPSRVVASHAIEQSSIGRGRSVRIPQYASVIRRELSGQQLRNASRQTLRWLHFSRAGHAPRRSNVHASRGRRGAILTQGNYTNKYEHGHAVRAAAGVRRAAPRGHHRAGARRAVVKKRQAGHARRAPSSSAAIPKARSATPPSSATSTKSPRAAARGSSIDPPDGKIPPMTPEARSARRRRAAHAAASATAVRRPGRLQPVRPLHHARAAGSMMPAIYGNSYQIVQGPGFVAIRYEMIHETRVIPLDGRAARRQGHPARHGRRARPLGRQHARRRDDELQAAKRLPQRQRRRR